jgi:hypothetical protein
MSGQLLQSLVEAGRDVVALVMTTSRALHPKDRGVAPIDEALSVARRLAAIEQLDADSLQCLDATHAAVTGCARALEPLASSALASARLDRAAATLERARRPLLDRLMAQRGLEFAPRPAPQPARWPSVGSQRPTLQPPVTTLPGGEDAPIDSQLASLADDCLATIAQLLRTLAQPLTLPWPQRETQQRLLAELDALWSLQRASSSTASDRATASYPLSVDVVNAVQRFVAASPLEPARHAAAALTLGSARGEAAAQAVIAALRLPDESGVLQQAVALAPNTRLDALLRRWCCQPSPERARLALQTAQLRGVVDIGSVAISLLHASARVRERAALAAAELEEQDAAVALLRNLLADEHDANVMVAACIALASHGALDGLELARQLQAQRQGRMSRRASLRLFRLLAVAGGGRDLPALLAAANSRAEIALLGWLGQVDAAPTLIAMVAQHPSAMGRHLWPGSRAASAAEALTRILGAKPDPMSGAAWSEHVDALPAGATGAVKLRGGVPYTPQATLTELASDPPHAIWETARLELAIVSGGAIQLRFSGWASDIDSMRQSAQGQLGAEGARRHKPGEFLS